MDTIEFSQLLASRICHDLISPVSAVNNGLELLLEEDDDAESRKRALELVEDSAKTTALKLKLMRAAFGAGQSLPEFSSKNDLLALIQPIATKNKVEILWDSLEGQQFNRTQTRFILNLFLVLLEALPRGGVIEFSAQDDVVECVLNSQKLIFSEEKIAYLSKQQDVPQEPRFIGFTILHHLAEAKNFQINKQDNQMTLKIA